MKWILSKNSVEFEYEDKNGDAIDTTEVAAHAKSKGSMVLRNVPPPLAPIDTAAIKEHLRLEMLSITDPDAYTRETLLAAAELEHAQHVAVGDDEVAAMSEKLLNLRRDSIMAGGGNLDQ